MLELAVLGLLKEKPMSGYELQKLLTAKLGAFWRVSFGSLYPCLKRLSAQGALRVLDSPSMSRKKHVYHLTERGELLFQELLESADVHDFEQDMAVGQQADDEPFDQIILADNDLAQFVA